jgi:ferredoxin-thioredoxin reductase catalytic subunit
MPPLGSGGCHTVKRTVCSVQRDQGSHMANCRLYEDLQKKIEGRWSNCPCGLRPRRSDVVGR